VRVEVVEVEGGAEIADPLDVGIAGHPPVIHINQSMLVSNASVPPSHSYRVVTTITPCTTSRPPHNRSSSDRRSFDLAVAPILSFADCGVFVFFFRQHLGCWLYERYALDKLELLMTCLIYR